MSSAPAFSLFTAKAPTMGQTIQGYPDATPLLADPPALRAQAEREGFLFFKGLLPRADVLELRRQLMAIAERHGFIKPGTAVMDGIANQQAVDLLSREDVSFAGVGCPKRVYDDVQRLQTFHAMAHHPALIGMFEKLFGTTVLPHARNICRMMLPSKFGAPTPPHQDYIHIQGTKNVWTAWFPVGDCPLPLGNLSLAPRSHRDGVFGVKAAEGAGGAAVDIAEDQFDWYEGDFEAGDVLTFISTNVHKSTPQQWRDRIRLSCDFRFQPANEPIHEASLGVHCNTLTWEQIYEGWTDDRLKYYWKQHALEFAGWDDSIRVKGY